MFNLTDKTCLITGGAGSIGLAAARTLQAAGANIILLDNAAGRLERAVSCLDSRGVESHCVDITDEDQVRSFCKDLQDRQLLLDVIFSNAGSTGTVSAIADYPGDDFLEVFRVHVFGAFTICKYGTQVIRDGGSIIINSSVVGVMGAAGPYGYVTAKHAQVGFMRSLAKELATRKIRVNTLHPGPVSNKFQDQVESNLSNHMGRNATDILNDEILLNRHATPDEIAKSVLFLASDQSSFTTGSTLLVDGGMSI